MQPGGATWPWPRPRGVLGTLPGSDGPSRSWRDPWTVPGSVSHQQPTAESLRELRQGSLSICSTRGSWRSVRRGEMRRKGYVWSVEGGWNGFSTLEIQTPVEEQGCSRLSSHNFVWHPQGGQRRPCAHPRAFRAGFAGRAPREQQLRALAACRDSRSLPVPAFPGSSPAVWVGCAGGCGEHPCGNDDPSGTASAARLDVTPPAPHPLSEPPIAAGTPQTRWVRPGSVPRAGGM